MIRRLIAATAFVVALSPVALAQDAPKLSVKTSSIESILANPEAKAAFVKVMPEVAASEQLDAVKEMTIDAVKGMAPQYFPDDKVAELDAELAKVK